MVVVVERIEVVDGLPDLADHVLDGALLLGRLNRLLGVTLAADWRRWLLLVVERVEVVDHLTDLAGYGLERPLLLSVLLIRSVGVRIVIERVQIADSLADLAHDGLITLVLVERVDGVDEVLYRVLVGRFVSFWAGRRSTRRIILVLLVERVEVVDDPLDDLQRVVVLRRVPCSLAVP